MMLVASRTPQRTTPGCHRPAPRPHAQTQHTRAVTAAAGAGIDPNLADDGEWAEQSQLPLCGPPGAYLHKRESGLHEAPSWRQQTMSESNLCDRIRWVGGETDRRIGERGLAQLDQGHV